MSKMGRRSSTGREVRESDSRNGVEWQKQVSGEPIKKMREPTPGKSATRKQKTGATERW